MNSSIFKLAKNEIPNIITSSSLSDYYNNMNKLRARRPELLNIILPAVEISEREFAKLKVERLIATEGLNFEAVNALHELKSISN
jgi:hypothetical protein